MTTPRVVELAQENERLKTRVAELEATQRVLCASIGGLSVVAEHNDARIKAAYVLLADCKAIARS